MSRPSARRSVPNSRDAGKAGKVSGGTTAWERSGRGQARGRRTGSSRASTRASTEPASRASAEPVGRSRDGRTRQAAAAERPKAAAGRAARPPRPPVPAYYRRRRRTAVLVAGLLLLVAAGFGARVLLYDSGLTDVEDVTVNGLSTVPEPVVRDAAAVAPGGPLISVDTGGVARRVAAVEGVAAVEVRRAWSHTVEVNVTERVPVALAQTAAGLVEVDATGLPYRQVPDPPPALPRLTFPGVAPQDPATTAAMAVLGDLPEPLRGQVATVDVTGTQVTLGLADRRSVRWGDPERSADKLAVLGPLLGRPGTVYDVSSPDLPTVRP